jgi:hypothetical protein
MTLPDERYRAIKLAEQLLKDLCDRSKTPRVPKIIRQRASGCLRHYPSNWDLDRLAEKSPDVIIKQLEPLTRMVMSYDQEKRDEHAS